MWRDRVDLAWARAWLVLGLRPHHGYIDINGKLPLVYGALFRAA